MTRIPAGAANENACIWGVFFQLLKHPGSRSFCGAPRHCSLKYVSIPVKKCLAQRKNPSLPVTSCVFRHALTARSAIVESAGLAAFYGRFLDKNGIY